MASQRLAEIADLKALGISAGRLDEETPEALNRILDAASAKVIGMLKKRYTFPLAAWGDDLRLYVCQIASYLFRQGTGYTILEGQPDTIRDGYKDAIASLKDVANGRADLDDVVDATPADDEGWGYVASDPIIGETPAGGVDLLAGRLV
jgi:phage gp36-like protein